MWLLFKSIFGPLYGWWCIVHSVWGLSAHPDLWKTNMHPIFVGTLFDSKVFQQSSNFSLLFMSVPPLVFFSFHQLACAHSLENVKTFWGFISNQAFIFSPEATVLQVSFFSISVIFYLFKICPLLVFSPVTLLLSLCLHPHEHWGSDNEQMGSPLLIFLCDPRKHSWTLAHI